MMTSSKNQPTSNSHCCGNLLPWLMLIGLVIFGFSSRLLIADIPNFKPIAAIALFSGFFFRRTWMAVLTIALALLISDWQIGSYQWPIALSVYGSLLVGCFVGRYFIGQTNHQQITKSRAVKTGAAALMMSCLFFVVTNFAVWACGAWYPQTTEGLISCYANALPFFKYTVVGDCLFTAAVFGCYALSMFVLGRRSNLVQLSAEASR